MPAFIVPFKAAEREVNRLRNRRMEKRAKLPLWVRILGEAKHPKPQMNNREWTRLRQAYGAAGSCWISTARAGAASPPLISSGKAASK